MWVGRQGCCSLPSETIPNTMLHRPPSTLTVNPFSLLATPLLRLQLICLRRSEQTNLALSSLYIQAISVLQPHYQPPITPAGDVSVSIYILQQLLLQRVLSPTSIHSSYFHLLHSRTLSHSFPS